MESKFSVEFGLILFILEDLNLFFFLGNGGYIYCGLSKDSTVFGLQLSRDEKDQFRLGVDRMMMDQIKPVMFHHQFDLLAVPVLEPGTLDPVPDLYVIGKH